jgi:hypothetical protein
LDIQFRLDLNIFSKIMAFKSRLWRSRVSGIISQSAASISVCILRSTEGSTGSTGAQIRALLSPRLIEL